MAIPAAHRLKNPRILSVVLQKGKSLRCPFFAIRFLPSLSGIPQATVVVSKKTEKTAVGRNILKRRCREAFFRVLKNTPLLHPSVAVIFPFESTKDVPFELLEEKMDEILRKISA
ncbi:MAG: ribonuclease P protein component [Candidatus Peregrinibacteria bacterium]